MKASIPKTIKSIPVRKSPGIIDAPINEKSANIKKRDETLIDTPDTICNVLSFPYCLLTSYFFPIANFPIFLHPSLISS